MMHAQTWNIPRFLFGLVEDNTNLGKIKELLALIQSKFCAHVQTWLFSYLSPTTLQGQTWQIYIASPICTEKNGQKLVYWWFVWKLSKVNSRQQWPVIAYVTPGCLTSIAPVHNIAPLGMLGEVCDNRFRKTFFCWCYILTEYFL
jgi:hypothetical protein